MAGLYDNSDRVYDLMQRAENVVADVLPGGHLQPYRYDQFWISPR